MTHLTESEESVYLISAEHPNSTSNPALVSLLATSKTCGLALLIDKLVVENNSPATERLIKLLINRFHHNCVVVKPSVDDNSGKFIFKMIEAAALIAEEESQTRSCLNLAAKLFVHSIKEFELDQNNLPSLEHNLKEFAYHYYRAKLGEKNGRLVSA